MARRTDSIRAGVTTARDIERRRLLASNRKPYLSNIAKALGVALPRDLEVVDRETARARLAAGAQLKI